MRVRGKDKSILQKFMIPILSIMLAQTILFACIFLFGGTINSLDNNSFDILTERTLSRKNYLENSMLHWANLEKAENEINSAVSDLFASDGVKPGDIDQETASRILNTVSDDVIRLLRENSVTDAFIVLNNSSQTKQGLYLRDLDPTTNSEDNSDLQIEHAPPSVTKQLGISLSSAWTPNLDLRENDDNAKFYYMPIEAALTYPEAQSSDLGYWSLPFISSENSAQYVTTYTIPLRTSDGMVYGVLGTGVLTDYVASRLPHEEINIDKKGVYVLGIMKDGASEIVPVATSGAMSAWIMGSEKTTELTPDPKREGIYTVHSNNNVAGTVYTNMQPLRLYNTNTPFEGDQWVLLGMLESKYLLDSSYQVMMMVLVAFFSSILFGIISAVIVGRKLTSPIAALVHTLRSSSAEARLNLKKTHITEIDRLADAVQTLSKDIEKTASRFSQIIHAADISIGAYEYNEATNQVVFSGEFFPMLGLPDRTNMTGEEFASLMKEVMGHAEVQADPDTVIAKIIGRNGEMRWLRLKNVNKDFQWFGVLTDITHEILEKRKIEYERDYDPLTNLLNRRAFHAAMQNIFKDPKQLKTAAFVMWDLDNLKYINDTYGHDYGDKYIITAANVLHRFAKSKNTVISRISGDEFYVFLYGHDSKESMRSTIQEIWESMNSATMPLSDSRSIKIGASAGVSWYPDDTKNYHTLIKYADFAMYTAKKQEKGQLFEFDKARYKRDSFLLNSKEELDKLIKDDSLTYAFQPIVDAHTGDIFGFEALMRPHYKYLNQPTDVLRVAEAESRLRQIERLTLFNSVRNFIRFPESVTGKKLFVNTLPGQMLFGDDIIAFQEEFSNILDQLVFELIETDRLDDEITHKKLKYFKAWGAQIAIDDYGTGYNNESVLLKLNPDYVKIDMSFVRNIDTDQNRQLLLQTMLSYLKSQNIRAIAEGIETPAEMRHVISCGVDYLQGYYLGMPADTPAISSIRAEEIHSCNM